MAGTALGNRARPMVGDGVNDAAVLAPAGLGMAVGTGPARPSARPT